MKLDSILYITLLILGCLVAIGPWTFIPVCNMEICQHSRNIQTILGAVIAVVSLVGVFKSLE